jgi:hypothetical protein
VSVRSKGWARIAAVALPAITIALWARLDWPFEGRRVSSSPVETRQVTPTEAPAPPDTAAPAEWPSSDEPHFPVWSDLRPAADSLDAFDAEQVCSPGWRRALNCSSPGGVELFDCEVEGDSVRVRGVAPNDATVGSIVWRLRSFPGLSGARLREDKVNASGAFFTIEAKLTLSAGERRPDPVGTVMIGTPTVSR